MADFTRLKNYIDSLCDQYPIASSDVIVMREHEQVFRGMNGFRYAEKKIPLDGKELYYIFSCTKMCTCVAAMQLIERGKMNLSDKLADYIPEFAHMKVKLADGNVKEAETPITIHQLMTMTGGFGYELEDSSIVNAVRENPNISTLDLVRNMSKITLHFEPGTKWKYSLCHDILGGVIEAVSGMKFSEYLTENIFKPLGMAHTGFVLKQGDEDNMAPAAYVNEDGSITDLPAECNHKLSKNYESGGAGLISSTEDYVKLADALANLGMGKTGSRILSEQSVDRLRHDELTDEMKKDFWKGPYYSYGLGFRTLVSKENGARSPIGEFGWEGTRGCYCFIDTDNRIAVFYATQIASEHAFLNNEVHPQIRDLVYDALDL